MRAPEPVSAKLHGRVIPGAFRPHPLARNPHLQTLLPTLRPMPKVALRIERRELSDGDFVDLGWVGDSAIGSAAGLNSAPVVVLLHGLTGGFESKYARGLAREVLAMGWRAVILQFRGAGPEPNRLNRHYHHGDTGDVRELLNYLRAQEPTTPFFAVGWSLGGNVLLKYLGEEGAAAPVKAAVAVSVPFQIKPCAEKLRTGFSRIYQHHLLTELRSMMRRKHHRLTLPLDLAEVARCKDFFEFDDLITARLNGFRDAEDYYTRSSSGAYLGGIERPVLVIHAKDDPFMTPDIVPDARRLPPDVTIELCDYGGHVGFMGVGPHLAPDWWLEQRIPEYLRSMA
jgi:uncharacterized protein